MTEEPECIYTIIESEYTLPAFDMIHKMVQWAHKHGLDPTERIYANNMTSFFAKDRTTYCLEIYMLLRGLRHRYDTGRGSYPYLYPCPLSAVFPCRCPYPPCECRNYV